MKLVWLSVYINDEIHSWTSIFKKDITRYKNTYLSELSELGTVKFKITMKEPFYGW